MKVNVLGGGDMTDSSSSLPSGLKEIMGTQQRRPRALPTPPDGTRYDFRLFRALLANLERDGLNFPLLDAQQSGKDMLTALAEALQYVLPFDRERATRHGSIGATITDRKFER